MSQVIPYHFDEEYLLDSFTKFLKIRTISFEGPEGSYWEAVIYCLNLALTLFGQRIVDANSVINAVAEKSIFTMSINEDIELCVEEYVKSKPVFYVRTYRSDRNYIVLSSHYDVVPVEPQKWVECDSPFGTVAPIQVNGESRLYARGAQDMKITLFCMIISVCRLYYKSTDANFLFIALPDEEIGGIEGALEMIKCTDSYFNKFSPLFDLVLDEGMPSDTSNCYRLFFAERAILSRKVHLKSPVSGHGSLLVEDTIIERLNYLLKKYDEIRTSYIQKLCSCAESSNQSRLGDVTTLNITYIGNCGLPHIYNIIPTEVDLNFDLRLPMDTDSSRFFSTIFANLFHPDWNEGIDYTIDNIYTCDHPSKSVIESSRQWANDIIDRLHHRQTALLSSRKLSILEPEVFPAATDSRHYRKWKSIPSIGFSPIMNCENRMHGHDEYISLDQFFIAIKDYEEFLEAVVDVYRYINMLRLNSFMLFIVIGILSSIFLMTSFTFLTVGYEWLIDEFFSTVHIHVDHLDGL